MILISSDLLLNNLQQETYNPFQFFGVSETHKIVSKEEISIEKVSKNTHHKTVLKWARNIKFTTSVHLMFTLFFSSSRFSNKA